MKVEIGIGIGIGAQCDDLGKIGKEQGAKGRVKIRQDKTDLRRELETDLGRVSNII